MLKTKFVLVGLFLGALVSSTLTYAQSGQSSTPQIYGEPDGLTGADCEGIMMRLDFVAIAAGESGKDQTIIIIARLGSGESARSLNRRRLRQVADYVNRRVSRDRIITAEGERVRGLGQLEFYVGGKLNIIFKVKRNRDLVKGCAEVHDAGLGGSDASKRAIRHAADAQMSGSLKHNRPCAPLMPALGRIINILCNPVRET